jgi:type 1 glutamine amidotransferase/azurin
LITRLDPDDTAALVRALADPNMFWRTTAQRLIVQGTKQDAVPALLRLVAGADADATGLNAGSLHALWTLKGLGQLGGMNAQANQAAYRALRHKSAGVRKAAVQVLPDTIAAADAVAVSGVLLDENLNTRLAAILRASELPQTSKLLAGLKQSARAPGGGDKWISTATRLAMAGLGVATPRRDALTVVAPSAIERAVTWKYATRKPPPGWMMTSFDAKSWREGKGGFGTRQTPAARVGTTWKTSEIWLRRVIELPDAGEVVRLKLHHDEDCEVYVNGVLAFRARGYSSKYEVVDLLPAARRAIKRGRNVFAVHCRQTSGGQYVDFGLVRARTHAARWVDGEIRIKISAVPNRMAYDRKSFTVPPGTKVSLTFTNPDHMPHNIVVIREGTLVSFGAAVDVLMKDPAAAARHYVPQSEAVIAASTMVDPGETQTITFTSPMKTGDYPFVCTFPGHWRMMQGVMTVAAPRAEPQDRDGLLVFDSDNKDAIRTLMIGGGGSHDFGRWFGREDGRTLSASGLARTVYTEDTARIARELSGHDVLYLSNNKPIPPASRDVIFKHAEAGKGLLILHPSTWYNWRDWPRYNRQLVGGGSKSHEPLREFEVRVTAKNHSIMKGVPVTFRIVDELYRWAPDPRGTSIEVLAVGHSLKGGVKFPVVWIVKHGKARIVCNTLGHDGRAHELQAYKTLLRNSLKWVGGK